MRALLFDAWCGLQARRGPTLIAAGGLMLAMTVCLLVAMLAVALSQTDPTIADPDRIVVLDFKPNNPGEPHDWFTTAPLSFAELLRQQHVPLDLISRVAIATLDIDHQGRIQPTYLVQADPDLVPLLSLKTLSGDLQLTLARHDGIAVSVDLVRKLWGELSPQRALGRQLESRGLFYTVTAVIPNPDPRSPLCWQPQRLAGNALAIVGYESQAVTEAVRRHRAVYEPYGRVFARLRSRAAVDQIGGWMREAYLSSPQYAQLPVELKVGREAAYFRGLTLSQLPFKGAVNELRWRLLGSVAAASTLLLFLAAFNCVNLQTASLLQRQRETALRLSVGADTRRLLLLWGFEGLLGLAFAASGALLAAWWLAPAVANWMALPPTYSVANPVSAGVLFGLMLAIVVLLPLTIGLPAWTALRRAPAPALQGRTASEGPWGRRIRQGLLMVQLFGALLLLSLAGVLAMQQQHLLHADRGFAIENRLTLSVLMDSDHMPNMDAFLAGLDRHPAVKHWAFSGRQPARGESQQFLIYTGPAQHKHVLSVTTVSPSFFATYGMTVLVGEPRVGVGEVHLVLDAKAVRLLGFASPQAAMGELLQGADQPRVVAVVKDVKLESARESVMPQAFVLTDAPQWNLTVHGTDLAKTRRAVEELWTLHGPPVPYEIQSADEQRADAYRQEQQLTTLLTVVALLAVCVAMLGVYALIADTLRRRRTELVLHRLHGAGDIDIARQATAELAAPLLISLMLALPLAVLLGQRYLTPFVDRIGVGAGIVLPILAASSVLCVVTAMAALRHVQQALAIQPVEALK